MTSILLLGATGLVGKEVLRQALADRRVSRIVAPTRRALAEQHPKLENPIVDFDALPAEASWWGCDGAICALGTTMRRAGSRAAFFKVDHDYVVNGARLARQHGVRSFAVVTAVGANPRSSFFYPRVKGEVEQALEGLSFPSLTIVRPSFIGGERQERRPTERAFLAVLGVINPLLPRGWRMNPAANIARVLIEAAVTARPGTRVVASSALA
ncbi:MAG: NAD-dependent dehydratase [Alphaproteobacteria bacterium]|nr:NAD-dependent dehydratase [Alphaproteobacteria bacterium]